MPYVLLAVHLHVIVDQVLANPDDSLSSDVEKVCKEKHLKFTCLIISLYDDILLILAV